MNKISEIEKSNFKKKYNYSGFEVLFLLSIKNKEIAILVDNTVCRYDQFNFGDTYSFVVVVDDNIFKECHNLVVEYALEELNLFLKTLEEHHDLS